MSAFTQSWIVADGIAEAVDIFANVYTTANADIACIFNGTIGFNVAVVIDVDVVAVVASERVTDGGS